TSAIPQSKARISTMALVPMRTTPRSVSSRPRLACSSRSASRSAARGRPETAGVERPAGSERSAPASLMSFSAMLEWPPSPGDPMTSGWPRYDLYVLTDVTLAPSRSHADIVRAALAGGADAVQIRDKGSTAGNLGLVVSECQPMARKFGAALFVNDRVDVAMLFGADGAHVGPE